MVTRKKDQPYNSQLKGVAALLGTQSLNPTADIAAEFININQISLAESQPRRYFNPQKLQELSASIKEHGVLEPLLARPLNGQYELVAGERRYRAAKLAGLTQIPIVVKQLTDQEALQLALIENLQREDLNPVEETQGILDLLAAQLNITVDDVISLLHRMQNEAKGKVTQNVLGNFQGEVIQNVFDSLGLIGWESFATSRLPLLKLPPDILNALQTGKIAYTKASAIARIKDAAQRHQLLEESIQQQYSLAQIKAQIKKIQTPAKRSTPSADLGHRMDQVYKAVKRSKVWNNPQKRRRLEKLLASIENLIESET